MLDMLRLRICRNCPERFNELILRGRPEKEYDQEQD